MSRYLDTYHSVIFCYFLIKCPCGIPNTFLVLTILACTPTLTQVSDILCRDEIIIKSEEQVFEAVQRWVSYVSSDSDITPAERQVACPRLLNHVRLPQLSPEYIMSKVSNIGRFNLNVPVSQSFCF